MNIAGTEQKQVVCVYQNKHYRAGIFNFSVICFFLTAVHISISLKVTISLVCMPYCSLYLVYKGTFNVSFVSLVNRKDP